MTLSALVAGGTGALGRRIVARLLQDGWRVHATGRDPAKLGALQARGVAVHAHGAPWPVDFHPAVIVNAAGLGGGFEKALLHAANVAALEPLIALAARSPGCLLIQLSSPAVQYRCADRLGIGEDEPFSCPISLYAASKQAAEMRLRASGVDWAILRVRAGYGHGAPSMVERLRAMAGMRMLPLLRGGRAVIDLVHVDDVADAVAAVATRGADLAGLVANVAGPEALSFRQIVEMLASAEGREPRWLPVPSAAVLAGGVGLDGAWRAFGLSGEPPLTRHAAGSLVWSQTLDLTQIAARAGWRPWRRFSDHSASGQ